MTIQSMKRITIASEGALRTWLANSPKEIRRVLLVTKSQPSSANYVSRQQVQAALTDHGWVAGARYTLNANLLGHVIIRED